MISQVTFLDEHGLAEEGEDQGGLTAEMHALFWREVLRAEHGLFEQADEGGAYLPRADAPPERLELVGRVLLKSVLDNHPTGAGLGRFLFEFLSDSHDRRVFVAARPREAVAALADYDAPLAASWLRVLVCRFEL